MGADLAKKCHSERLGPEFMAELYTPIFRGAIESGMSFRLSPERAGFLFFSLQVGTLHTFHMMNKIPHSPGDIQQLATDTAACFLHGALETPANVTTLMTLMTH